MTFLASHIHTGSNMLVVAPGSLNAEMHKL